MSRSKELLPLFKGEIEGVTSESSGITTPSPSFKRRGIKEQVTGPTVALQLFVACYTDARSSPGGETPPLRSLPSNIKHQTSIISFMEVSEAAQRLMQDEPIVVAGKTFEPTSIEELKLETGEMMYWIMDGADVWLSLDVGSEEIILFSEIEGEFDPTEDTVVYSGEDYEFTYEGEGILLEDGEEVDRIFFRDYEGSTGRTLRVAEYAVNSEISASLGQKLPDDDLQEA